MTNEELAAEWEKRAEALRAVALTAAHRAQPPTLRARANQLDACAAELLRNTPNAGHDGCVPSSGHNVDQHTHEGQTGYWLFPSGAPETGHG